MFRRPLPQLRILDLGDTESELAAPAGREEGAMSGGELGQLAAACPSLEELDITNRLAGPCDLSALLALAGLTRLALGVDSSRFEDISEVAASLYEACARCTLVTSPGPTSGCSRSRR